jgi:hypothetical protein
MLLLCYVELWYRTRLYERFLCSHCLCFFITVEINELMATLGYPQLWLQQLNHTGRRIRKNSTIQWKISPHVPLMDRTRPLFDQKRNNIRRRIRHANCKGRNPWPRLSLTASGYCSTAFDEHAECKRRRPSQVFSFTMSGHSCTHRRTFSQSLWSGHFIWRKRFRNRYTE